MKLALKRGNYNGNRNKVLVAVTLQAEDMFQCQDCGRGVYIKDCTLEVEYNPEHQSPTFSSVVKCPEGHWVAYSGGKRLSFETVG